MKKTIIAVIAVILTIGIIQFNKKTDIAHSDHYEQYLTKKHLDNSQEELNGQIRFWEDKLGNNPGNFVYQKKLAGLYAAAYKRSGDIGMLHRSDSLLLNINARIPGQAGVLQALTTNAVTRHAFADAETYIRQADSIGENRFVSSLMLTDVLLERGKLPEATHLLNRIASRQHFDYLIREVKFHDESDQLGKAIDSMEEALALARSSGSPAIINWSLSNLADMYGHDGRIRQAYETYLEALQYDPADLHALKGIAWIAFSHDRNPEEARRILNFLKGVHPVPDYDLFLAEIAAFEGDTAAARQYEDAFLEEAGQAAYGNMYKGYISLLRSQRNEPHTARAIAEAEVQERPHPTVYQLLAWSLHQEGQREEALRILNEQVIGQTGEPTALYHSGIILKENGKKKEAKKLLRDALEASFELGPVVTAEIKRQLQQI